IDARSRGDTARRPARRYSVATPAHCFASSAHDLSAVRSVKSAVADRSQKLVLDVASSSAAIFKSLTPASSAFVSSLGVISVIVPCQLSTTSAASQFASGYARAFGPPSRANLIASL